MIQPQRSLPWHVTNKSDSGNTPPSTGSSSFPPSGTSFPSPFTVSNGAPTLSVFGSFVPRSQSQLQPQPQPQVQPKLSGQVLGASMTGKGNAQKDKTPDQEIMVRLSSSERSRSPQTKSPGPGERERSPGSIHQETPQTDRSCSSLGNNVRRSYSSLVRGYKVSELPPPLFEILRKRSRNDIEIHRAKEKAYRAKMRALKEESKILEIEEQVELERWLLERKVQKE